MSKEKTKNIFEFEPIKGFENFAVIILAGGKSSRMAASGLISNGQSKVMLIVDNEPFIGKVIQNINKIEFGQRIVVINPQSGPEIQNYLGTKVDFAVQERALGTANAVIAALDKINRDKIKNVMVLYGDDSAKFDPGELTGVMDLILTNQKDLAFMAAQKESNHGLGRVVFIDERVYIVEQNNIMDFARVYGQSAGEIENTQFVNVGGFCCSLELMEQLLPTIEVDPMKGEYYLTRLIDKAQDNGLSVGVYEINPKNWQGFNKKEEYEAILSKSA